MDRVTWARSLAERLLADSVPRRWSHVQGVGRKAESIAYIVHDPETLICAAWLHDIGYAPGLVRTGLHSLDGARYLRTSASTDDQLCRLVAHHSYAVIEARNRGLLQDLIGEFSPVDGLVLQTLTYCDMTTSPYGEPVDVRDRLDEILTRYEENDVVSASIREARPQIEETIRTVTSIVQTAQRHLEVHGDADNNVTN